MPYLNHSICEIQCNFIIAIDIVIKKICYNVANFDTTISKYNKWQFKKSQGPENFTLKKISAKKKNDNKKFTCQSEYTLRVNNMDKV